MKKPSLVTALLTAVAVSGVVAPVAQAATATSAFRGFDAVATAVETNGSWKHLALRGDQYVIFSDSGIFEGPAYIRHKWPFLPAHFTADVDAASVVRENSRWKYMFTQGTERLIFFDTGIVEGPQFYPGKWPFLGAELYNGFDAVTAHVENRSWIHLATAGENYAFFTDGRLIAGPGLLRNRWPWLPQQFMSHLDDAAVELENGRYKISFYKGAERLIFSDSLGIEELVDIRIQWPFLSGWLGTAAVQPVAAPHAGVNSPHRTWSCVVPSGYTWSNVRSKPSCGSRYEYFLLDAVNVDLTGQWACAIPSDYSYSSSRQGINCSASPGSSPYEYRLVKL